MKKLSFVWQAMDKGIKARLILSVFIVAIYGMLNLLNPLLFSFIIDNVIDLQPVSGWLLSFANLFGGVQHLRNNLWIGSLIVLFGSIAYGLFIFVKGKWNGMISETTAANIRNKVYRHLQLLPYSYHVKAQTGDLIQRCTSDVDMIRRFLAGQFTEMCYALFTSVIALVILFQLNTKLAWIACISLPFIFGMTFFFFGRMQSDFKLADTAEGKLSATIQENLSGMRVVKAFNKERYEIEKMDKDNQKYRDLSFKVNHNLALYWGLSDFICIGQILLVVIFGIFAARAGELSVGNYFVFISYESMIVFPMRQLGRILSNMGKMFVSIGRLEEIMDEPVEDVLSGETPKLNGDIVFDHVCFKYDDGITNVLDDVSFKVKAGTTVAIMGPTGSGKSSLVHLLTRLYDCTKGDITISGIDIKKIQKQWLRKNVGIVLQEPFLFSRTIMENIKIARPDATSEQIRTAARIADVHEVIEEFDRGYDTLVGEKGVTLSGGQKQRIAIARTVINDSPILIFDDSLSAVDTETDAAIRKALRALSGKMTMFIITQRIASASEADKIIVLENKKITEEGTHEQLINKPGLYQRVYAIQTARSEVA